MTHTPLKRIALFVYLHRDGIENVISHLIDAFETKGIAVLADVSLQELMEEKFNKKFPNIEIISNDVFEADMAISVGGDGTFLNTAASVGDKNIPILGINGGRLGFLADVSMDDIDVALQAIFNQKYTLEERSLLHLEISEGIMLENSYALNDIAIQKQDSSSMIIVEAKANGELINTYQGDGLIISTPTGSTAYSMSVGGPILVPQVESFVLSPIASHSLNVRPLIVPDSWAIDLSVHCRTDNFLVSLDGRSIILSQNVQLKVKKADYKIKLVKPERYTFFNTLRNKLLWGADKRI